MNDHGGPLIQEKGLGVEDPLKDPRVQRTAVCPETCDPHWDAEMIFPLLVDGIKDILSGRLIILARDEDTQEDGSITYDELGYIEIPFTDIFRYGVVKKASINVVARWFPLLKTKDMVKVTGSVRLSLFLHVNEEDMRQIASPGQQHNLTGVLSEMQSDFKRGRSPLRREVDGGVDNLTVVSSLSPSPSRKRNNNNTKLVGPLLAPPLSLRSVFGEGMDHEEKEYFDEVSDLDEGLGFTGTTTAGELPLASELLLPEELRDPTNDLGSTWNETTGPKTTGGLQPIVHIQQPASVTVAATPQVNVPNAAKAIGSPLPANNAIGEESKTKDEPVPLAYWGGDESMPPMAMGPGDESLAPIEEEISSHISKNNRITVEGASPPVAQGENLPSKATEPPTTVIGQSPMTTAEQTPTPPPKPQPTNVPESIATSSTKVLDDSAPSPVPIKMGAPVPSQVSNPPVSVVPGPPSMSSVPEGKLSTQPSEPASIINTTTPLTSVINATRPNPGPGPETMPTILLC